jgi:hypothetical protein
MVWSLVLAHLKAALSKKRLLLPPTAWTPIYSLPGLTRSEGIVRTCLLADWVFWVWGLGDISTGGASCTRENPNLLILEPMQRSSEARAQKFRAKSPKCRV